MIKNSQPKTTQYGQDRRSMRDGNKFGSAPRVGKTADKQPKKSDYRNESDTNLPVIRPTAKKPAGQ